MQEIIFKVIELKEDIIKQINSSNLPAFILKPILKDITEQLERLEIEQNNEVKNNKLNQKMQSKIESLESEIKELKGGIE